MSLLFIIKGIFVREGIRDSSRRIPIILGNILKCLNQI